MTPKRKTALWVAGSIVWGLALFVFFAYRTFPYDRVEGLLADRIARAVPALDVQFAGFRPSWLTGVTVDRLIVRRKRTAPPAVRRASAGDAEAAAAPGPPAPLLSLWDVTARARPLELVRRRLGLSLHGKTLGGTVDVRVALRSGGGRKIVAKLHDLDLAKYPYLKEELGTTLAGVATVDLDLDMLSESVTEWTGTGTIEVRDAKLVEVTAAGFPVPPFSFSAINADIEIKDGKATIKRTEIRGEEIADGQITGQATLRPNLERSPLDLTARFKLNPALEQQWGSIIGGQLRRKDAEGYYGVYVRGTLMAPRVIR